MDNEMLFLGGLLAWIVFDDLGISLKKDTEGLIY